MTFQIQVDEQELCYLLSVVGTDKILHPTPLRSADDASGRVHRKLQQLENQIELLPVRVESSEKVNTP